MIVIWHHFHDFDEHSVLCGDRQQHILESGLDVTDKNLEAIFWTPDEVILEAEYDLGILAVPAAVRTTMSEICMSLPPRRGLTG
jgi:hypothetical protein